MWEKRLFPLFYLLKVFTEDDACESAGIQTLHEDTHLSEECVPLRKSVSKPRDHVTPELRDIPAALKAPKSPAASSA